MSHARHAWALILAGGEGRRLHALTTTPSGTHVPKQFCSFRGEVSLIEDAIARAGQLVPYDRMCVVVVQHHRQWWSATPAFKNLPPENVIVQPRARGTAIAVLFPVLQILLRDPEALVALLPADHYVRDEHILCRVFEQALARAARVPEHLVLLGLTPEDADTELGYIEPGRDASLCGRHVAGFIEKPDAATAHRLVRAGALWNTFIVAAAGASLVRLFLPRFKSLIAQMRSTARRALQEPASSWAEIVEMYSQLPDLDFSRDLLQRQESSLRVMCVPPCGWSDLGTPRRVGETLRRLRPSDYAAALACRSDCINLAIEHARLLLHA